MDVRKISWHIVALILLVAEYPVTSLAQYERTCVKRDFMDYYNNANYDEGKVPQYTLPDAMLCLDGTHVTDTAQWEEKRRLELMQLFTEFMYGKQPSVDNTFSAKLLGADKPLKSLNATRRDILLHLTSNGPDVKLALVWRNKEKRAIAQKTILGLSFISVDSILCMRHNEARPKGAEAWNVEAMLDQGFAFAVFQYTEAESDKAKDDFKSSALHRHYYKAGQEYPLPDEWGAIACWAWTASRAVDALELLARDVVNVNAITIMGHSRLGKTALWAGATDKRFHAIVAVNSGCCGAALSRRCFGETIECVNEFCGHWFCGNFKQFSHREKCLPFDQHELIALLAPRQLIAISGTEDLWADPKGEELGCLMARPIYELYGKADKLVYKIRKGAHAVLKEDWKFILRHLE